MRTSRLCLLLVTLLVSTPAAQAQIVSESIGDHIVRFYPDEEAKGLSLIHI